MANILSQKAGKQSFIFPQTLHHPLLSRVSAHMEPVRAVGTRVHESEWQGSGHLAEYLLKDIYMYI